MSNPSVLPPQPAKDPSAPFLQLIALGIFFTGNPPARRKLYDTNDFFPGPGIKVKEAVIDARLTRQALAILKEASAFDFSHVAPAETGPYAQLSMNEVLAQATEESLHQFLRIVRQFPKAYRKNEWLSGAYLGWVRNGAPTFESLKPSDTATEETPLAEDVPDSERGELSNKAALSQELRAEVDRVPSNDRQADSSSSGTPDAIGLRALGRQSAIGLGAGGRQSAISLDEIDDPAVYGQPIDEIAKRFWRNGATQKTPSGL